ncbi:hypothetical protein DRP53_09420 [candidate division WOR-3 bacterium]|uniref:T9SS type A sorting domain-containing protein n=1 Tax=candidate division WOR-3 bacterium TaxID=2052148 RepID=A0A660SFS1_UNCW3|nr:MAG: hypothetical protein DRP53_09420 [candidate division WOR-3 bacterium]
MVKLNLWLIAIIMMRGLAFAQPDTLWTRTFGGSDEDVGASVQQTTDNGYIIVAYTMSYGPGSYDVYLIKIDTDGDTLWTKIFGGPAWDFGHSVQQTADGGYIIAGQTYSYGSGSGDVYLIKTDANGDTLWIKTIGGIEDDGGYSVQQTADGGYIIAGYNSSVSGFLPDVYLVKTDANGDTLWTKIFGGNGWDKALSVRQTTDGGYIIAGETDSYGAGGFDVYLIKTDADGNTQWTKTIGGRDEDWAYSVQQTTDGGYIIAGRTYSFALGNPDSGDVYLIKTDANGDTLWTKTFGGLGDDVGYSVQQTTDGGYIIAGYTDSYGAGGYDVYLIKIDANGDTLWTKTFGGLGDDGGRAVQQTTDGGYIIAGWTESFGAGSYDIYLIKTEPEIGVEEGPNTPLRHPHGPTIITGPLQLTGCKKWKVFDVSGREIKPERIKPGIYFIEVEGRIERKVVKIR